MDKAHRRLSEHDQCHQSKGYCACVATQYADLTSTKSKSRIISVLAGISVSKQGDHKRGRMGAHMPTIGEQCH